MTSCPAHNLLQQFLQGGLGLADFEAIDLHVASCESCQSNLDGIVNNGPYSTGQSPDQPNRQAIGTLPTGMRNRLADRLCDQKIAPQKELTTHHVPKQLGDFRIIREIGRGGMGVVYSAEQLALGRTVALKVLPANVMPDSVTIDRFRREAAAAASLHHTNIVPVYEAGQDDGIFYYAMQLITGNGLDVVRDEIRNSRSQAGLATDAEANQETASQRSMNSSNIRGFPARDWDVEYEFQEVEAPAGRHSNREVEAGKVKRI